MGKGVTLSKQGIEGIKRTTGNISKFENERDLTYREGVSLSDKQIVNYDKDQYGELNRNHILEQYKIYVEMADELVNEE